MVPAPSDPPEPLRHINVPDLPQLSPSALNRFLGCEYRTFLDILERRGELDEERRPPRMQLLFDRGERHEQAVVDGLVAEGCDLVALEDNDATPQERAARTLEAMRAGREVLHQGCLVNDTWVGYPDFLVRVQTPSAFGDWSYEVHDAKLSSHARPSHIFQLLFYTEELERLQGVRPARMHLMLGDGERPAFFQEDFSSYASQVREHFVARYGELAGDAPDPAYPYPVSACEFCHWWHVCDRRRRDDDHLSLVAGLQKGQGLKLEAAGVHTLPALAALAADVTVPRMTKDTLGTLRAQADLQLRSRGLERPLYDLLRPEHDRGLGRLPAPSPGDVHFDFEGDQYWGDEGLEYLFGTVYDEDGSPVYLPLWATSRAEEKVALETWIDWITARLAQFPDLHVFHYNSYETVALKRLVARHATRENELDELLRRRVFVDLYGIARQAMRAGTERYGLKSLEPVYGFERDAELRGAIGSMHRWQAFLDDGDQSHLDGIAGYNEDDCLSTRALYAWLLDRRPEAEALFGLQLDTLAPEPAKEPTEKALQRQARIDALRPRLLDGLPDDESLDTPEERGRRLTFNLVGYHVREAKPVQWALFARREKTLEQLRDEDAEAIADLAVVSVEGVRKSWVWTLTFPEQPYKLSPGDVDEPLTKCGVKMLALDEATRTLTVSRAQAKGDDPPRALGPGWPFGTAPQEQSLFRFADGVATGGVDQVSAAVDMLMRRAPRFQPGVPPLADVPHDLDRLKAQVGGLDRSALVIQGPPGTGKTYTGARLALHLVGQGLRVGVTATAHKAINNFLAAMEEAADEEHSTFRGWKKKASDADNDYASDRVTCSKDPPADDDDPVRLLAGTAWLWASDAMAGEPVDVLFIDEAGQVSLADAIAVAGGARSVVLLGDPQQLAHVSQGTHPHGSGASVLTHMLGDTHTIEPDRGVLLRTSWRMHPDVCDFVSKTMYDGRVEAVDGCERQVVRSPGLSGSGLRMVPVHHQDNRGRSPEEAEVIAAIVADLLAGGTYTDRDGDDHVITLDDILIVAPYNAQVRCLRATPGLELARIGTVDKFQGQEAPVVLFSMATSSGEDVSRGMSFLFSSNRLNVAVSRAQTLAVIVCSPLLLGAQCSTVDDMRLVNMLCRFAEAAG